MAFTSARNILDIKEKTHFKHENTRIDKYTLADKLPQQLSELTIRPAYSIRRITNSDRDRVLDFLGRFFFRDEPLNIAVNLLDGPEDRCYELEEYVSASLPDGVSVAAVDDDDEFVGVVVNGIARREEFSTEDKSVSCPNPKFQKILKVLGHLEREARIWDKLPPSCHTALEVRIVSTHSEWRGKGLMKALCEESEMSAQYTIAAVEPGDVGNIMKLLRKTFYVDEPLNQAVGLISSETDTCAELDEYCTHSLHEGLSFKATDNEGNIVGVIINGVCPLAEDTNGNDLLSQAQKCPNPKFQKILYILAKRECGARLAEEYPEDKHVVEIKVTATDNKWRRKGIMNALIETSEKAIKDRGYRLIRLDTSSAYSAMSAKRLGYTCKYRALYRDLKMDGQPLIVPEPPHLEDCVFIKELFPIRSKSYQKNVL